MNIKEIAMKIKSDLSSKFDQAEEPTEEWAEAFAEALVAELVKENEPFCFVYPEIADSFIKVSCGTAYRKRSSPAQIALYTIPPTVEQVEQVEQEIAEAIAKHFEQSGIGGEYLAEAIRSGAWKEYK